MIDWKLSHSFVTWVGCTNKDICTTKWRELTVHVVCINPSGFVCILYYLQLPFWGIKSSSSLDFCLEGFFNFPLFLQVNDSRVALGYLWMCMEHDDIWQNAVIWHSGRRKGVESEMCDRQVQQSCRTGSYSRAAADDVFWPERPVFGSLWGVRSNLGMA